MTGFDGQVVLDEGCDGYEPGPSSRWAEAPDAGWQSRGLAGLLSSGEALPRSLGEAYDARRMRGSELQGRVALMQSRRALDRRVAARAEGGHLSSEGEEAGDAAADGDEAAEYSDGEVQPVGALPREGAAGGTPAAASAAPPAPHILGATPEWMTAGAPPRRDARNRPASEEDGRNCQSRARDVLSWAQSRVKVSTADTVMLDAKAVPVPLGQPMWLSAHLWAPLAHDLPLPYLAQEAMPVRRLVRMAPQPGEPKDCLVLDAQSMPVFAGAEPPERQAFESLTVRALLS